MKLREYQEIAVRHLLAMERCNLWAGMGLGKTVSTLSALDYLYRFGFETRPTLILAPLRVARGVWPDETLKWPHINLRVSPIIGTPEQRLAALNRDCELYTINYENLEWLITTLGKRWPFGRVVADESTKLKGHRLVRGGTRAKALSHIAHNKTTKSWINLTGTPSPNGLIDLWGQQWFVDNGKRLGSTFTAFKDRWFYPGYDKRTHPHVFAQEQIHARLSDCTLSIKAEDWFDLKEPIVTKVMVDLPTKAMALYKQMLKELYIEINEQGIEAFNAASKSTKCLQLAAGAIYNPDGGYEITHDAKLEALSDIVEETAGEPLLVAYQWRHDLDRIKSRFKQARELKTKQDEDDWNAGKIPMLIVHPLSAGHGLNLQHGGCRVVYFNSWWALEPHQQVLERVGPVRQMQSGYDRNVWVYHILARGTLDVDVLYRQESKAEVQDILLNAMKRGA